MRSKESDPKKALRLLKEDLINGPNHCFGDHTHCSTDFCTSARERESGVSSSSGERVASTPIVIGLELTRLGLEWTRLRLSILWVC